MPESEAEWFARLGREYAHDPEYLAYGIAYVLTDIICREFAGLAGVDAEEVVDGLADQMGKSGTEVRAFLDFEDASALTLGEVAEYLVAAGIAGLQIEVAKRIAAAR